MRRFVRFLSSVVCPVPLVLAFLAGPASAQLDHYNVYSSFGLPPPAALQPVVVRDQFGTVTTVLDMPSLFLVPAEKNGELIRDPFTHFACYDTGDPQIPPPQVIATHQFGEHLLDLAPSNRLCTPTDKLIDPDGPLNTDHYLCYGASGTPLQVTATIADQFQQQNAVLFDPFLFCTPADKNGEGIQNPDDHLACYAYDPPGIVPPGPPIANQFFPLPDGTQLDLGASFALCLPAKKSFPPPPPLDHFSVYTAEGPDGPPVVIRDQWQGQQTDLGRINLFMVPADKNQEGITDPFSHLACNEIFDGEPGPPFVWTNHQFGHHRLQVGQPRELCVPTEKLLTPGPVDVDHFKCYDVVGAPLDITIGFADQFQAGTRILADPFLFCNPADKNGEGIQNPDAHLTCYKHLPIGEAPTFPIPIVNQFLPAGTEILLLDQPAFCLPSCKDSDGDTICDENDPCDFYANTLPINGGGGCGGAAPDDNADCNGDGIPNECQCGDYQLGPDRGLIGFGDAGCAGACFLGGGVAPGCNCFIGVPFPGPQGVADTQNDGLYGFDDAGNAGAAFLSGINYTLTCTARPEGTAP